MKMKKNLMKRGISPVIATILLIAMVVAIALIIFLWFKNFQGETITKFGDENIQLACNDVKLEVRYSGGNLYIDNLGDVPIYKMNVRTSGTSREEFELNDFDGLAQGKSYVGTLPSSVNGEITLIPVLLGRSGSEGDATHSCENQGYKITV